MYEMREKFASKFIAIKTFDECPNLTESLKNGIPVIIDLGQTDYDTARKTFDFLSGATYMIDGNVEKIANSIFVFLPKNINKVIDTGAIVLLP